MFESSGFEDEPYMPIERLDRCPSCEGNFLNHQPGKPMQRYGDEWLLDLACNACGYEEKIAASEEGLDAFNSQIRSSSLSIITEAEKISKMTETGFTQKLVDSGFLAKL